MTQDDKALIGIIMGSDSDWETLEATTKICDDFSVPYEAHVVSAHRTPDDMFEYAKKAHKKGLKVIVAGAGGAAHLPEWSQAIRRSQLLVFLLKQIP